MRNKHSEAKISVRAISGSHVVVLAWDLKKEEFDSHDLLGFAVERTEFDGPAVSERYFLRGIKPSDAVRGNVNLCGGFLVRIGHFCEFG